MKIEPNIKYRPYSTHDVVRIVNLKQILLYIKHGVFPVDIYTSLDDYDRDILVCVFLKEETLDVYDKWIKHELK